MHTPTHTVLTLALGAALASTATMAQQGSAPAAPTSAQQQPTELPAVDVQENAWRQILKAKLEALAEGIDPNRLGDVDLAAVAGWAADHYPSRPYPGVMIGSSSVGWARPMPSLNASQPAVLNDSSFESTS